MTLDPRITFSRASLGTYYGSDGLLKYAPHNLLRSSQDFTDTFWVKGNGATITLAAITAPDGTLTGNRLNHVTAGTGAGGTVATSGGITAIGTAIFSCYAKAGTKGWLRLNAFLGGATGFVDNYFNLSTGTVGTKGSGVLAIGMQDAGNGWYRCWLRVSVAGTSATIAVAEANGTVTCTSPGDIYIWGAQAESVTTATTPGPYLPTTTAAVHGPRFDCDPVTHAPLGLLIEEARFNDIGNTQNFTNAEYTKTGLTVTADQTTAPDGTLTADLITASATPATMKRFKAQADGQAYTMSVFAKKGSSDFIYLCGLITGTGAGTPKAYFNLATGALGTVEAGITSATIQNVGSGWYRCALTRLGTAGGEEWMVGLCDGNGSDAVTVGRTAYLWGSQCEVGAFVSSYIPSATTASRAADVATMTGVNFSSWYNQSAGTFVVEFNLLGIKTTQAIVTADAGTGGTSIRLYASGTDPGIIIGTTVNLDLGTLTTGVPSKIGVSFATDDVVGCFNGGAVIADTPSSTIPIPTQFKVGSDVGGNTLNGWIRRIRFFNVAKSDAALQALTT